MAEQATQILFPVGRLVGGSTSTPRTTDFEGAPLVYKSGANIGKPRASYSIGVAFKKNEDHWAKTKWGAVIWQVGHAAWPQGQGNSPTFSWKITDGDSQVPNKKGKKPCDNEGFPGHWIVWFSGSSPFKTFNRDGSQSVPPDSIKPGYFIQVAGSVGGNSSTGNPGVYINHELVALSAFGDVIELGLDAASIGFGQEPLPPGAQDVPAGGISASTAAAAAPPPAPPSPPSTQAAAPAPAPAIPTVPSTTIMQAAQPPAPPAPPAPPTKVMLPAANGVTYEAYVAANWSDAQMIAAGILAP